MEEKKNVEIRSAVNGDGHIPSTLMVFVDGVPVSYRELEDNGYEFRIYSRISGSNLTDTKCRYLVDSLIVAFINQESSEVTGHYIYTTSKFEDMSTFYKDGIYKVIWHYRIKDDSYGFDDFDVCHATGAWRCD